MTLWSQETVIKMLNVYRKHEILWNTNNINRYNKILKEQAWEEIAQEMNMSVVALKAKFDILSGQMRREKMTITRMAKQGLNVSSDWYAYEHMKFLLNRRENSENLNSNNAEIKDIQESTKLDLKLTKNEGADNNMKQPMRTRNKPNINLECNTHESTSNELIDIPPQPSTSALDEDQDNTKDNTEIQDIHEPKTRKLDETVQSKRSIEKMVKCSKKTVNTDNKAKQRVRIDKKQKKDSACNTQESVFNELTDSPPQPSTSATDGDIQIYTNFIATKLRMYSQRTKNLLHYKISELLFKADTGVFDNVQSHAQNTRASQIISHQLTANESDVTSSSPELKRTRRDSSDDQTFLTVKVEESDSDDPLDFDYHD